MSEATGTITESTRSRLLVGAPVQEQTVVAAGVDHGRAARRGRTADGAATRSR